MNDVAKLSNAEREELFLITAREKALPEAVIEKDFWVCWTLDYLFHESPWKEHTRYTAATTRPRLTTMCAPLARRKFWKSTSARIPTQNRHRADLARATPFLRLVFEPQGGAYSQPKMNTVPIDGLRKQAVIFSIGGMENMTTLFQARPPPHSPPAIKHQYQRKGGAFEHSE